MHRTSGRNSLLHSTLLRRWGRSHRSSSFRFLGFNLPWKSFSYHQSKIPILVYGCKARGYIILRETTIIAGALDLTEKTALEAMTLIESTFSLDVNSKLDWEALGKIMAREHSRVPISSGGPQNIGGLLLVKNLLIVRAEDNIPVSAVSFRRIPKVPEDMLL